MTMVAPAGTAPAWADSDVVRVVITSVTPGIVTDGAGSVTITGTVTNLTTAPLGNAQATLWTSGTPYVTLDDLTAALADPPKGVVLSGDGVSSMVLVSQDSTVLASGHTVAFTVTAPLTGASSLGIDKPGAVYIVGVSVTGASGRYHSVEFARALAVVSYPSPTEPVHWVSLVELTAPPSLLTPAAGGQPAVFANDDLATALAGPLKDALDTAVQPGVTAILDPQLWDAATAMAGGYDVRGPDGTTTPGTGQAAARSWLDEAAGLVRQGTYRSLYGTPDVAAAVAANRIDVLAQAQAALPDDHPLARLPLAVVPVDARCDDATLAALARATTPALVVCANEASDRAITTASGLAVLSLDGLPPIPSALAGSSPGRQAMTDAWLLLRSLAGQPVAGLFGRPVSGVPATALPLAPQGPAGLTPSGARAAFARDGAPARTPGDAVLAQTDAVSRDVLLAGQLAGDVGTARALVARVTAGLWSGAWASDPAGEEKALAWADASVAPIRRQIDGGSLEVLIASRVHLSAPDQPMPVTIVNHYDLTVQVAVRFHSDNPQRLSIPASGVVSIAPGATVQVRVTPQALANGLVPIRATLVTLGGQEVGTPVDFDVITTAAGRLGWLIIAASGGAFLVATFLRVRQVRHQRLAARTPPE